MLRDIHRTTKLSLFFGSDNYIRVMITWPLAGRVARFRETKQATQGSQLNLNFR